VTRWIVRGCRAGDGSVIRLEARRFPSGWKSTHEALETFLERLTAAADKEILADAPPGPPVSRKRQRELDAVDKRLDAAGIR
jgi:hypothetical protein